MTSVRRCHPGVGETSPRGCRGPVQGSSCCRSARVSKKVLRYSSGSRALVRIREKISAPSAGTLSDEELARKSHDSAVRSLPEERAAELTARMLALPDAQIVEDLTALLTSAGER